MNKWLNVNKLKLNTKKIEYMIISKKKIATQTNVVKIGDDLISRVENVKYLGITIDEHLNFNKQMDILSKKLASKINFMKRISRRITFETRIITYNAFTLPHFDFCASLSVNCMKEHINRLQKLQNRAMRLILRCEYRSHTDTMLKALDWLSVNQRITYNIYTICFQDKK